MTLRASLRIALPIFLGVRVLLLLWMWGVRQLFPDPLPPLPGVRPYVGVEPQTNPWLEPWQRWDTPIYQAIAERGPQAFGGALFTPPLYPALMRVTGELVGGNSLLGGLIVSNLAYLGALVAFHQIALEERSQWITAQRATLYLAVFPTAFFFMAAYTESLLLLGATVALLGAARRRWLLAGLAGATASLSRLIGVAIAVPLSYLGYRGWRESRSGWPWIPLLATLAGAAVLPTYAWQVLGRSPLAPFQAQSDYFKVSLVFPGWSVVQAVGRLVAGHALMADVLDLAFLGLFVVCGVAVWRRYSTSLGLLYAATLAPMLIRSGVTQPLLGTTRYVLALFPAFIVMAEWGANRWRHRLILYGSTAGLLFLSGQFALWGWVG